MLVMIAGALKSSPPGGTVSFSVKLIFILPIHRNINCDLFARTHTEVCVTTLYYNVYSVRTNPIYIINQYNDYWPNDSTYLHTRSRWFKKKRGRDQKRRKLNRVWNYWRRMRRLHNVVPVRPVARPASHAPRS